MHVEYLEARNFRNLAPVSLDIAPGFVVIEGPNAQGKTNTLEALYVCATGKSFRAAPPRDLVQHDADAARLSAIFSRQQVRHHVEVTLTTRRSVKVDGRGLKKTSQLLNLVNVVAFFPDDLRVIKGSPEERRRFLDRAVANHVSEFVDDLAAYEKALKTRNKILRDHDAPSRAVLEVYEEQMLDYGSRVHEARERVLGELAPLAEDVFTSLMGSTSHLRLELDGGLGDNTHEDYRGAFAEALASSWRRDVARGSTSVGPHRGDVRTSINAKDARSFGSQGQQRACILALKLAEVRSLATRLDSPPILLLDDVSSELDQERTRMLFESIHALKTQVWVSTTGAAPLPLPAGVQRLRMRAGVLS